MVKYSKLLLTVVFVAATLNLNLHVSITTRADGTIPTIPEELLEIDTDSE